MKKPCWMAVALLLAIVANISLMVPSVGAAILEHAAPTAVDIPQQVPLPLASPPPCANPKGVGVVANSSENTVSFLNLDLLQECAKIAVPSFPIGASVTPDGKTALVSSFSGQRVSLFDLTVDPPVLAGTIATTTFTESVCITPDSRFAVTVDGGIDTVDVRSIDIAVRTTINSLAIPGATGCVISDTSIESGFFTVVIADFNSNLFRVLRLDTTTGTLTDPGVTVGNPGSGLVVIAISARGRSLAIATDFFSGTVTMLRIEATGTVTVVGTLATGVGLGSLAIAPNGETAWVVNHDAGSIAKLAISPSDQVTDTGIRLTIPVCPPIAFFGASGIAVNADSTQALVSNACSNTLQQLDIVNNRFTGVTVTVGFGPAQIGLPGGGVTPTADLALTKSDSPDPVEVGQHLTYTETVTNKGPDAATGAVLTDTLPAGVTFVSATPSQGTCSGTSTVTCNLGTITNGAGATVTIVVTPTAPGTLSNTASVTSDVPDPVPANNTAKASTTVWSLLFRDGTTSLGVNTATGEFTLTYLVDGVPQTCSGAGARVDDGLLTISSRCTEDSRDTIRAVGPINATLTIELIDQTGPGARDRVVRRFTLARSQLTCVQPPEGLVAWWPGDGDAKDIVGTNHGTLQNGATFATGQVGQAFSFDGVDDYVAVADSPNLDGMAQLTVDAWVKFNALPSGKWQWIVSKAEVIGPGTNSYSIWLAGDTMKITAAIENSAGSLITVQAPEVFTDTTSFHHVAITYDGSSLKLYIDGVLKNSGAFSGTIRDTTFPFFIGRRSGVGVDGHGDTLNGLVDEVEIYNRALSAAEIQAIFNAGSAGKCKVTRVLGIDTTSSWAYNIVPFLSRITFTKVSPADFATVNLNNFDVLLVSETFLDGGATVPAQATLDALKARETDLANWISAGHGVVALSEPVGTGRFAWLPAIVRPTVGAQIHADTVHIVNSSHPVMAGLTDADLSGWNTSSHGNFTSAGALDVLVTDGGTRPITLAGTFGLGKIVITDQDPDFHHHFGTVKPAQVRLVQNAINWAASPVPGVAALALTGCTTCRPGDQLTLEARVTPGPAPVTADVYVALQLPDKTLLFMQADGGFTRESRPLVTGWTVVPFRGEIFRHTFSRGEPAGRYTWLLAFTEPGTSRIMGGIGAIAQAAFTFSP